MEIIARDYKAKEQRQAEEKAAKKRAEAKRRAALEARIDAIRTRVVSVAHQDAAVIREALQEANAWTPDPDEFAEVWPQAMKARAEVRHALETLLVQREALEARQAQDAARWQAQQEVLARQQAQINRQRAEETCSCQALYEQHLVACAVRVIGAGSMDARSLGHLRIALQCKRFSSDLSLVIAYELGYRDGSQGIRRCARPPHFGAHAV